MGISYISQEEDGVKKFWQAEEEVVRKPEKNEKKKNEVQTNRQTA